MRNVKRKTISKYFRKKMADMPENAHDFMDNAIILIAWEMRLLK